MRLIVGYSRVSTSEQAENGVSLDAQKEKINAYATVKDWELAFTVADPGESGKHLNRLGIGSLIGMIKRREVSQVIVTKLDRLTRSVTDLNYLVRLFEEYDVALVSIAESLDATTATGRLMMNLLASVSQWEREIIGERTKDALRHLKAQGKPYCRPVMNDKEVIGKISELRQLGMSLAGVAKELNNIGFKTARGGVWHASTVKGIIDRTE